MRVDAVSESKAGVDAILATELRTEKDELLVTQAAAGSNAAFEVLFQRYQQKMLQIANRITRNREDAEDAVQQAFKHAFVHLKAFAGDARFSTWLTRIAINEALQLLRKRRPGHSSLENHTAPDGTISALQIQDDSATPEERFKQQELHGMLNEAIGELRPILRKVVELYEIGELPSSETAQVLGLTTGTVKARAFRARGILRRKLDARFRTAGHERRQKLFVRTNNGRNYAHHNRPVATAA